MDLSKDLLNLITIGKKMSIFLQGNSSLASSALLIAQLQKPTISETHVVFK